MQFHSPLFPRTAHLRWCNDVEIIDQDCGTEFIFSCLPLVAREYKFGAAILVYESPRHYTSEDRLYAERVGYEIALALWNFQQSAEIQQRLKESNALAEIGRALSETEHTGTDKVLQLIVDLPAN